MTTLRAATMTFLPTVTPWITEAPMPIHEPRPIVTPPPTVTPGYRWLPSSTTQLWSTLEPVLRMTAGPIVVAAFTIAPAIAIEPLPTRALELMIARGWQIDGK